MQTYPAGRVWQSTLFWDCEEMEEDTEIPSICSAWTVANQLIQNYLHNRNPATGGCYLKRNHRASVQKVRAGRKPISFKTGKTTEQKVLFNYLIKNGFRFGEVAGANKKQRGWKGLAEFTGKCVLSVRLCAKSQTIVMTWVGNYSELTARGMTLSSVRFVKRTTWMGQGRLRHPLESTNGCSRIRMLLLPEPL